MADDPQNPGSSLGPVVDLSCGGEDRVVYGAAGYVFEFNFASGTRRVLAGDGTSLFDCGGACPSVPVGDEAYLDTLPQLAQAFRRTPQGSGRCLALR